MEINYIDEFIELVNTGNFMDAADALYISQSTLSRHIQSIENDLGVQLFNRTTRKVELNKFGKAFLPYARQISSLRKDYTLTLSKQMKLENHLITIGVIPTMSQYHITDVLSGFQEDNKNYQLNMIEADTSDLIEMLQNNTCDFAFIREDSSKKDDGFQRYPFFTDHLVAIVPMDHPLLAQVESVSLNQLKLEPFLLLSKGSMMYSLVVNACKAAGFSPNIIFTGSRAENIIDLVRHGMGIGLLNIRPLDEFDTTNVRIVDIVPEVTTQISLACKSEESLSPSAWQFLRFYKSLGIE